MYMDDPSEHSQGPVRPDLPLDDLLLYRLHQLFSTAGGMVTRLCESRFGITRREWRLIATLASRGEASSSDLAGHARLDRARTSKAVSSLVDKRLVLRTPLGGDRRQVRLRLTPEGRTLYDTLFPMAAAINAELMDALEPDARLALDAALRTLQAHAETMVAREPLPKLGRGPSRSPG